MMKRANRILVVGLLLVFIVRVGMGALSDPVSTVDRSSAGKYVIPVSQATDWVTVCSDLATADNGGSTVLNPTNITRSAQRKLNIAGAGTTVLWRVKYTTGLTITACGVQPFGFDRNGTPQELVDRSSSSVLSFVSVSATDVQDGTYSYTAAQETDGQAGYQVMGTIKVLATGTGAATAVLQARVK